MVDRRSIEKCSPSSYRKLVLKERGTLLFLIILESLTFVIIVFQTKRLCRMSGGCRPTLARGYSLKI